jgi:protein-tyrosine phosphatase
MAECVMKYLVKKNGREKDFYIDSAATSTEEIGNTMHYGTRNKLRQEGIPANDHRARQMTYADYESFDLLIGMDRYNIQNMTRIARGDPYKKIRMLLKRPIADPWYTDNFDETYTDVLEGCTKLLKEL